MSEHRQTKTSEFPILLRLGGRRVLVVGNGHQAVAKVRLLLPTGAIIVVVASAPCTALTELAAEGRIELHQRSFFSHDREGVRLCVVALSDAEVADAIAAEAGASGVLVNVVDRADVSDFSVPVIVD